MSNRRKTRLIIKQLELPFQEPEIERCEALVDLEPEPATSANVVSFCSYKANKFQSEEESRKEEALKEITDSAYKIFL